MSSTGSSNFIDPDLARVVEAWASLPAPIRRAVLALVTPYSEASP